MKNIDIFIDINHEDESKLVLGFIKFDIRNQIYPNIRTAPKHMINTYATNNMFLVLRYYLGRRVLS